MEETIEQSGNLKFTVDSNLLFELGERLVTRPSIALSELIKNAYDADATKATVIFDHVDKPGGIMIIEDNGHGMTFEEIENNWMRIATQGKREKPISRIYCRPLSGAKGVGRLAVRRLGTKLTLQSVAERDKNGIVTKEMVVVNFNWEDSFSPGQDLVNTPISYARRPVPQDSKTGVTLLVEGVRDAWTKQEVLNLRRDLLSVQSPYPDIAVLYNRHAGANCQPDPGFSFELIIDGSEELKDLSGELGDNFLKAAWAKLEGTIDERGVAHYDIDIQQMPKEQNYLIDRDNDYPSLTGASFRIYFFVYRRAFFLNSGLNLQTVTRKGREEGGVRIYLDGFRVFPYGDPGDDWLRLDEYGAKNINLGVAITPSNVVKELASSLDRPWLLIPKNSQLFGAVSISQVQHSGIEMNVSRERLNETQTFTDLRRFVQNGIYWATIRYSAFLAEERITQIREQEKERALRNEETRTVLEVIEDVKVILANESEIPQERRTALLATLNKASQQVKTEEEERISQTSMLRVLASAGTTLLLMNHQLQAFVGAISQIKEDLLRLRPDIPEHLYQKYDKITDQVSEWHNMVESQVSMLGFLLSPDSRQRRRRLLLHRVVEDVKRPMSLYMKTYHISFENNMPPTLRTPPIYQSELYAVLINILSNALKAVFGRAERRVSVGGEKIDGGVCFWMMDTGVGVPLGNRERVFRPFVTNSLPNPVLGVGTGLGLTVVKDILDTYEGSAQFVDAESPWKTRLEIFLPERRSTSDN